MKLLKLKREPDFVIGREGKPYLRRWFLIPRNRYFNVYLHHFLGDDIDRALHCHPWRSLSVLLKGGYIEHLPGGKRKVYKRFSVIYRKATHAHRIELHKEDVQIAGSFSRELRPIPAWTLFITGRKQREWGFYCPQGFRHWRDFVSPQNHGDVGRGCDD